MNTVSTTEIGQKGEEIAAVYLTSNGFDILERNWRHGRYEIDIIAVSGRAIHFVEVKCRKANSLTRPEEALTQKKLEALMKAAEAYISQSGLDCEVQFDAVTVEYSACSENVRYIPNAMTPKW